MTDFSMYYTSDWRSGQMPKSKGAIVSHDTRHFCYDIAHEDQNEFLEWVAITWSNDRRFFGEIEQETAQEFLDRADIQVRFE